MTSVETTWRRLETWGREREWAGTDPYDGLNATRFVRPLKASVLGRRVLTQAVKRSPVNLRGLLGVPAGRSPAALAHVLSAYARSPYLDDDTRAERIGETVDALGALVLPGFAGACWGYHFDVQTRVFFYPQGSPNTIATAFAGMALLDAHAATGRDDLRAQAESVGEFFLEHVPQTEAEGGAFFGYLVGDRTPIHNANMLVCALLARLGAEARRTDMADAARAGIAYTIAHQRADGGWLYGELPHLQWIDNFHTGYVLDSLMTARGAGLDADPGDAALQRGLSYWAANFFDPDGAPRYLPDSRFPVDSQCVAQAIQTASLAEAHVPGTIAVARGVYDFAVREMQRPDGAFMFQIDRRWRIRTPHIRWAQAPMLQALSELGRAS